MINLALSLHETANSIEIQTADGAIVADLINEADCCVTESMRQYAALFAASPDMADALKAYSEFTALFGRNSRPSWFTDDDAWAAYVKADELRIAAIAKAGAQ